MGGSALEERTLDSGLLPGLSGVEEARGASLSARSLELMVPVRGREGGREVREGEGEGEKGIL